MIRLREMALMTLLTVAACSDTSIKPVTDVVSCVDRTEARLFEARRVAAESRNEGSDIFVLDGDKGGDVALAESFMKMNGWRAMGSTNPKDQNQLYLIPNTSEFKVDGPLGRLEDGPRLACRASKLSGVPFVSVTRRTKDLSSIIYEIHP